MIELFVSLLVVSATPFSPATPVSPFEDGDNEIERAAREYRIQVYDTFHRNRPEYDTRREAGDRVLSGYRRSGHRPEHGETLKSWFADARRASLPRQIRPLPELPEFAAELPAKSLDVGHTANATTVDGRRAASDMAVASRTGTVVTSSRAMETSFAGKVGGAMLRAALTTPYDADDEPLPQLQIDIGSPIVERREPETAEDTEPVLVDTQKMVPVAPEKPIDLESIQEPLTPDPSPLTRGEGRRSSDRLLAAQATEQPLADDLEADQMPAERNTRVATAPTAAPVVAAEPVPAPSQAPAKSVSLAPSTALQRLASSITSYNDAINGLVKETKEDSPAKLFDVARLLNDLVHLAEQRPEIASELALFTPAEKETLPQLLPLEPAITGLQATIDKTRSELDTGDFFQSDAERQQAQELLNVLEKQLHALSRSI